MYNCCIVPLPPITAEEFEFRHRIEAAFKPFYDDSLPGHPSSHALIDTVANVLLQTAMLQADGYTELDTRVLIAEAGAHDLLMGTPIKRYVKELSDEPIWESAFATNERRSSYLAGKILNAEFSDMFDETVIAEVIQPDIVTTTAGVKCETITGRTLVRGDIWNIGQAEKPTANLTMFRHSIQFFYDTNEIRRRSGQPPLTWHEYMAIQHPVMRNYVDVNLADHEPAEQRLYDIFNRNASRNVEYFAKPEIQDPVYFFAKYAFPIAQLAGFKLRYQLRLEDFTGPAVS